MINELVPTGLKGLIAAALLAALMSTIAAALNSVGTLMAVDIVQHFRPQTSDRAQVRIGRVTAVVVMLLAMAWSTQGGRFGSIFEAINKMPAQFLAPPICVVFTWGVFWRRGTKEAALYTLVLGFVLGFAVFLADLPAFGDPGSPASTHISTDHGWRKGAGHSVYDASLLRISNLVGSLRGHQPCDTCTFGRAGREHDLAQPTASHISW